MRALVYHGPKNVSVDEVPDARIERPTDALVRITTTNICGSDLHMYEGRTDVEEGKVLGHENMGEVIEVGDGVDRVKVGDRVVLPFNIGCGFCKNCEAGLTGFCLTANPGNAGAAYGYADMGPYNGGQAELLRVPYADWNALVLPDDAQEKENDYVMLSDILPTGYHGPSWPRSASASQWSSRAGPGRPDGRHVGPAARRRPGLRRRPPARPAQARRDPRTPPPSTTAPATRCSRSWTPPGARALTRASRRSATRPTITGP